jgi:CRP-like cAMP-binding protein
MEPSYTENILLRAAKKANRPRLFRRLDKVVFEAGHLFWPPGEPIPFVLFPERGIVSLQLSPSPGKLVEVALVGREGFAGVSLLLGAEIPYMPAVALTAGEAFAMPPEVFHEYLHARVFRTAAEQYLRQFVVMLARMSVCHRVHGIEKLCVDCLLLMQDRTGTDSFHVTQAFFSGILGVRRASVNRAATRLQRAGAIQYDRRGRLTILDRGKLEKLACSCYYAIKAESDEFLSEPRK